MVRRADAQWSASGGTVLLKALSAGVLATCPQATPQLSAGLGCARHVAPSRYQGAGVAADAVRACSGGRRDQGANQVFRTPEARTKTYPEPGFRILGDCFQHGLPSGDELAARGRSHPPPPPFARLLRPSVLRAVGARGRSVGAPSLNPGSCRTNGESCAENQGPLGVRRGLGDLRRPGEVPAVVPGRRVASCERAGDRRPLA